MAKASQRKQKQPAEQAPAGYCTPADVAPLFGVTAKTIANWCDAGHLPCETTLGGHRRIPLAAVQLMRARKEGHEAFRARIEAKTRLLPQVSDEDLAAEIRAHRDSDGSA